MSNDSRLKLLDIPQIFYINLDERDDRKNYMEKQFKLLDIKKYQRISANRFSPHNFHNWKNIIIGEYHNQVPRLSTLLNQFQTIIDWYDNNSSDTCLIMEDDVNLLTSKYWSFDWNYFFSRLPLNWDCVQMHIIGEKYIPMGLTTRTRNNHSAACFLISRNFAHKLKNQYYFEGKFKFHNSYGYSENWPNYHYQSADFVPYNIGITYSFPLFITNSTFISDSYKTSVNFMAKKSDHITLKWWKEESSKYSLDDLFYLDSKKRKELIVPINY